MLPILEADRTAPRFVDALYAVGDRGLPCAVGAEDLPHGLAYSPKQRLGVWYYRLDLLLGDPSTGGGNGTRIRDTPVKARCKGRLITRVEDCPNSEVDIAVFHHLVGGWIKIHGRAGYQGGQLPQRLGGERRVVGPVCRVTNRALRFE